MGDGEPSDTEFGRDDYERIAVLTKAANADILSDVRTFTVRDLDRKTREVLAACEREGEVKIRRRNGRTFTIKSDDRVQPKMSFAAWLGEIDRRRRALFPKPIMTSKQAREFDKLLASEDRLL